MTRLSFHSATLRRLVRVVGGDVTLGQLAALLSSPAMMPAELRAIVGMS